MDAFDIPVPRSNSRSGARHLLLLLLLMLAGAGTAQAQRSISMLIPTSNFVIGRTYTIMLFKQGYTEGRIRLEYSIDSMRTWKLIDTLDPALTGTIQFPWVVPDDSTRTGVLRVTVNDTTRARSAMFTIGRTPITMIRVYTPQSGSTLYAGSETTIMWFSENATGMLTAEYSLDSGGVWTPIADVAAREGTDSLVWSIPRVSSSRARVRVRTADSSAIGEAFGAFRILDPSLVLLRPNGGEQFVVDSLEMIIWSARDLPGRIGLSFSVDNGAYWFPIDYRSARQGLDTLYWPVPANLSNTVRLRIEQEDGLAVDESDGDFRIVATLSAVRDEATASRREALVTPNPARDHAEVHWTQAHIGNARMLLYDVTGATVYEKIIAVDDPGPQHAALDLRSLPAGIYHYDIVIAADYPTISGTLVVVH